MRHWITYPPMEELAYQAMHVTADYTAAGLLLICQLLKLLVSLS